MSIGTSASGPNVYGPVRYPQSTPPGKVGAVDLPSAPGKTGFNQFVRYTSPSPTPGKWKFYWREFTANYFRSRRQGSVRYQEKLRRDKKARWKLVAFTLATALGLTVFRQMRRTVSIALMMFLMSAPIKEANRTFPKLAESYEQVKQGNPTRGRKMFAQALEDSVYSIFQDFMKPLTFGVILAFIPAVTLAIRGQGDDYFQLIVREIASRVRLKADSAPVRLINRFAEPVTAWGDYHCNRLRQRFKSLDWLERN